MKRILTVLAASLLATTAFADTDIEKPYIGLDSQFGQFKQSGVKSLNLEAVRLRVGTEINRNLAVEVDGALGTTHQPAAIPPSGETYQIKLHGIYSIFVKPQITTESDNAAIYGILGYSFVGYDAKDANPYSGFPAANGTSNGFSFGAGVRARLWHSVSGNLDIVKYQSTYSAFSLGLQIPVD